MTDAPPLPPLPLSDRPRERLLSCGPSALSDVELVALVFGTGLSAAREVVARVGGAPGLARALVPELRAVPGVGASRACQLVAAVELGRRSLAREADPGEPLRTPVQAAERLRDMVTLEQEELHVLALDGKHRVTARLHVARGTLNVVHVTPREVFRPLVRAGAAACIVAHNHPSGESLPSDADGELTSRLRGAGELVGVAVLDHLILSASGWFAFSDGKVRPARA